MERDIVVRVPADIGRLLDERARTEQRSRNNMAVRILTAELQQVDDETKVTN
jgi:hypothetical protein